MRKLFDLFVKLFRYAAVIAIQPKRDQNRSRGAVSAGAQAANHNSALCGVDVFQVDVERLRAVVVALQMRQRYFLELGTVFVDEAEVRGLYHRIGSQYGARGAVQSSATSARNHQGGDPALADPVTFRQCIRGAGGRDFENDKTFMPFAAHGYEFE